MIERLAGVLYQLNLTPAIKPVKEISVKEKRKSHRSKPKKAALKFDAKLKKNLNVVSQVNWYRSIDINHLE